MKKTSLSSVAPLVAIALGATVAALPISYGKSDGSFGISINAAVAKDKGGDEDRGNDKDKNEDRGNGAEARADDNRGNGNGNGVARSERDNRGPSNTVIVDNRGPGNAVDRGNAPVERTEARTAALADARQRYEDAMEHKQGPAEVADIGKRERTLTDDETKAVLARGWQARQDDDGEFRNHGERVRTFVAIAKALGLDASVGAMQANFGTAAEGFTKPGNGPTEWQTADLDVNNDGKVTQLDLIAALNPPPPVVTPPPTTTPPPVTTPPTTPPVVETPPATTTPPTTTPPTTPPVAETPPATTTPPTTTTPTTPPVAEAPPTTTTPTTTPTPTPPATAPAA
jgi:hypothetical protein